jgi:hypothetical protein
MRPKIRRETAALVVMITAVLPLGCFEKALYVFGESHDAEGNSKRNGGHGREKNFRSHVPCNTSFPGITQE